MTRVLRDGKDGAHASYELKQSDRPMNKNVDRPRQMAIREIQHFLSTTSSFLQTLNDCGVESTNVLRERVAVGLESVQDQLDQVMESADEAAASIGEWIEQHPWAAVGVAAGLGAAVGCAAMAGGYAAFAPEPGPRLLSLRRSWHRGLEGRIRC
jgi:ElaB/YqjD/DUF883 family membrane-anchored ribosome-binding protein